MPRKCELRYDGGVSAPKSPDGERQYLTYVSETHTFWPAAHVPGSVISASLQNSTRVTGGGAGALGGSDGSGGGGGDGGGDGGGGEGGGSGGNGGAAGSCGGDGGGGNGCWTTTDELPEIGSIRRHPAFASTAFSTDSEDDTASSASLPSSRA